MSVQLHYKEILSVNFQKATREELAETLKITLSEMLVLDRSGRCGGCLKWRFYHHSV